MWNQFIFQTAGKIRFGPAELNAIGEEVVRLGRKVLLVAGQHAIDEKVTGRIGDLCGEAGADVVLMDSPPEGEPDLQIIDRGRALRADSGSDIVIGVGGGSIVDAAKAIAGLANEPGPTVEYFDGREIAKPGIPWIAVPTTAGAGAEVTKNSVLSDPSRNIKKSIRADSFFADVVISDPALTLSCPPRVTADSGMDALAQAIESYTSLDATPMTDGLAFEAARLLLGNLATAYRSPDNLEARSAVALGSLLAGVALANARLGAIHGLAHPIGIRWNVPHGRICAILLSPVIRFNHDAAAKKYKRLGSLVRGSLTRQIVAMREEFGIPANLEHLDLSEEDIDWIVQESLPSGSLARNPRPVGANELREILHALI